MIGGLAIGVPTLVFVSGLCSGLSGGDCDEWGQVIAITIPIALAGAGVGALIGSRSARWRLHYARGAG